MSTTFIPQLITKRQEYVSHRRSSLFSQFISWSESQNEARFVWLGVALLMHASLLTPFTVMAVVYTSNSFALIMASLSAMALSLVTNLAALPTKVTIPAFFLSIAIDIAVVLVSILLY